jgi:hypothetical protein
MGFSTETYVNYSKHIGSTEDQRELIPEVQFKETIKREREYIPSGSYITPAPYYNMAELQYINSRPALGSIQMQGGKFPSGFGSTNNFARQMSPSAYYNIYGTTQGYKGTNQPENDDDVLEGGSFGSFFKSVGSTLTKSVNKIGDGVKNVAFQADRDTRNLQQKVKKTATKVGDQVKLSATSKKGIIRQAAVEAVRITPVIAGEIGKVAAASVGLPPEVGKEIGKSIGNIAQKQIETNSDGYIKNANNYQGSGAPIDMSRYIPGAAKVQSVTKVKKPKSEKALARGIIVKRIMMEQGLNLPQASKYVKEYGLY